MNGDKGSARVDWRGVALTIAAVVTAALFSGWCWQRVEQDLRADLLRRAQRAAQTVDLRELQELSGTPADLESPAYQRLKQHFILARQLYPHSRFLYLMGQKADGSIFFYLDSEPPGSEDESPPGQVYAEATPALRDAIITGSAIVEGPVTDAWGSWVSAVVPLVVAPGGEVAAVFGMDEDAADWKRRVAEGVTLPASLAAGLALLIIASYSFLRWRAGLPLERRHQRWLRHSEAGVAAALGVALAALLAGFAHDQETRSRQKIFDRIVADGVGFIAIQLHELDAYQLGGLARLFAASKFVDRQEFKVFTQPLVADPLVQAWGWVPRVTGDEREQIEAQARQDGLKDFMIWEMDATGQRTKAGRRELYYPALYIEPLPGNEAVPGYDFSSAPTQRAAIEEALHSGLTTASDPITLVQESPAWQGILIFKPVLASHAPSRQTGFVVAALRMDSMLRAALAHSGAQPLPLYVDFFRIQAEGAPRLLARSAPAEFREQHLRHGLHEYLFQTEFSFIKPVYAFGKTYAMVLHPTPAFSELYPPRAGWNTFLYGVTLSGLLALLVGVLSNRRTVVEGLVVKRTKELRESEQKYRRLAESTRAVLWEVNPHQDRIVYISPQVTELTGWQPEQWSNLQFWIDRLHPEDRQRVILHREYSIALGEDYDLEYRFMKPDSEFVWLRDIVSVEKGEGKPMMLRGFMLDITQQKRNEHAIQRQLHELSLLQAISEVCIHLSDEDELIAAVTTRIGMAFYTNDFGVFVLDEDSGGFRPHPSYRHVGSSLLGIIPAGKGVIGQVARDGLPRVVNDILKEENYIAFTPNNRSELAVPVKLGERVIAVINTEDTRVGFYTAEDARLLSIIAGQLAVAIDRIRTQKEMQLRLAELETINRISIALRQTETIEEMLSCFLDKALAAVNAPAGSIVLYDPIQGVLRESTARGWFETIDSTPLRPKEGIAGWVYSNGEAYLSIEFKNDSLTREKARTSVPAGWGGACVPLRSSRAIEGVLFAAVELPRQLGAHDMRLLGILAEIAGNAIHRMRLYQQTVQHLSSLEAMRVIDFAISTSLDLRLALNVLIGETLKQLKVDAVSVSLYQPHALMLEYAVGIGFHTPIPEGTVLRLGEGLAGVAAAERRWLSHESMIGIDVPAWETTRKFHRQEGFVCHYAMPLFAKGLLKGVLEVYQRTYSEPDAEWLNLLEMIAGQAAIAIDNAQLYENLQRSNLELSLAYDATIEGWAGALELRDRETEGHTRRVAELTVRLGRAMGMSEGELVHLRRGALLHDIGKMGIPDRILLKPGALTAEEMAIVRQHPETAYRLLLPIAYLRPALEVPYSHHERWDGSGYPQGLKGEQIPLAGRIFAVVDVWDSLSSDRPYRKAWSRPQGLAYLRENAGVLFDPRVVEVFLRIESEDE